MELRKVSNILIEAQKNANLVIMKDSIIGSKDAKIANLIIIEQIRAEQLINANTQISKLEQTNKQLSKKLLVCKIVLGLVSLGLVVSLF